MKYIHLFSMIIVLSLAGGCSRDFDYRVSNSVFVDDKDNTGLPIYSEKGYNSFGVYWGLTPFTTERLHDPSKVIVKGDSCHIHFSGSMGLASYTLVISLPGYMPKTFEELLSLNDKKFDMTKPECTVSLLSDSLSLTSKILEGSFTIKRAQRMYVDKEMESVVLSGTFWFKAIINDKPVAFSNGRFDMRFGREAFFYLQGE